MATNDDVLLRAILSVVARQAFPVDQLREVALKGSGQKQLLAYNMCDGSLGQSEIAKANNLDQGNFSKTVTRWVEAGIVFRLGAGRETKLLHVYPLPDEPAKPRSSEK